MNRGITRREREVTDRNEIIEILEKCRILHLGLVDGDMPYVVPMNYGYTMEGDQLTLYMHGAAKGRKTDVMKANPNVFFEMECDVTPFDGKAACQYGTSYASIMGEGRAEVLEDVEEKKAALSIFMKSQTGRDFIFEDKMVSVVNVIKIHVTDYTAKRRPRSGAERTERRLLMLDLLLINGTIITVDENNTIIPKGYISVLNGDIVDIGEMDKLQALPEAKKTMDLEGHAVLPGLIDGHGHGGHCLTRTLAEHMEEWDDIAEHIYYSCTDEEFWYHEAVLAAAERIKFGTTTAVSMIGSTPRIDSIAPVEANLAGSVSTGIRQFSGIGSADGAWPKKARQYGEDGSFDEVSITPESAIPVTEKAVKQLRDKYKRGTCIVAPGRMGDRPNLSRETNILQNKEMYRIAEEYDVPLHTHAYSGDVKFLYETSPEVLNPSTSLTHSIGLSDEELDILADTGAYVFHGPTTYSNAVGHCKVMEMLERGVNLAVVTDGTAPDRSYDLWRDMKNVQMLQRFRFRDGGLLPCGKVLRMVTMEPAKALGIDKITGSLEIGKRADIITVDVMQPHLAPFGVMPVQRLVYHAMGQDVDHVIIEGELVMEHRVLTKVDEQKLLADAEKSFAKMFERLHRTDVIENPKLYDLRQY